ncbi:hypothetical protein SK128_001652, partial [Halocaridina rubra]
IQQIIDPGGKHMDTYVSSLVRQLFKMYMDGCHPTIVKDAEDAPAFNSLLR